MSKYLETKSGSIEQAVLEALNGVSLSETNKNDKSDDGEGLDAVQPKAVKKKFDDLLLCIFYQQQQRLYLLFLLQH